MTSRSHEINERENETCGKKSEAARQRPPYRIIAGFLRPGLSLWEVSAPAVPTASKTRTRAVNRVFISVRCDSRSQPNNKQAAIPRNRGWSHCCRRYAFLPLPTKTAAVPFHRGGSDLLLELPAALLDSSDSVIEIKIKMGKRDDAGQK